MKILLATDGSVYAQHAMDHVVDLCGRLKESSEVIIVYVKDVASMSIPVPIEPGAEAFFDVEQTRTAIEQAAENTLGSSRQALERQGVTVRVVAPWGRPADVICDTADAENVDLIVVGSSGMGQVAGFFLGSVSDRVLHRATRPVLVIRGKQE